MSEWKTIKTVPMDGLPVLVYLSDKHNHSRIHTATFHPNIIIIGGSFSFDVPNPTHWMPLPEPPK